jgi:renal tumor antigen
MLLADSRHDLRVIQKLGEGSFSEVFKVKSMRTNATYAVKRLKKRYRSVSEIANLPELLALRALQGHSSIVRLLDIFFDRDSGELSLVFEMLDINLYEHLKETRSPLDESTTLLLIYQLLQAVAFMHGRDILHRDLKPENCMLNRRTVELKIVDFGSARADSGSGTYTEYVGMRWYRAPECLLTSGLYGRPADVWAVGCILYELLTGRPLFPGKHEIDQLARIHSILGTPSKEVLQQFRANPNTQISFSFPAKKPQDLRRLLPEVHEETVELLRRLIDYDPRSRISAEQAIALPAFRELRGIDEEWRQTAQILPFP